MIVRGSGVARVERTGARTAVGGLGASLAAIQGEPSPLQKRTGELVARLGVFALLFCALVIVAYGLVHGDWFEGAMAGITLAIGLLPEEFPMVLAIFLAIGAFRLGAPQRAGAPLLGDGDARLHLAALRRQDRHAHRKPHDGRGALHGRAHRARAGCARRRTAPADPRRAARLLGKPGRSDGPGRSCARGATAKSRRRSAATESFPIKPETSGLHPDLASRRRRAQGREGRARGDLPPCRRRREDERARYEAVVEDMAREGHARSRRRRDGAGREAIPNRRVTFCGASSPSRTRSAPTCRRPSRRRGARASRSP